MEPLTRRSCIDTGGSSHATKISGKWAMSHVKLTDVEWINLNVLVVIHAGLQNDRAATCSKFALDAEQADYLRYLNLDDLWSLAIHVGDTTLFPPRADLVTLLSTPRPLAGPLALVRPPTPTGSNKEG